MKQSLRIIHGADFHLDAPFGALPPEKAAQRRGEQRELLRRLALLSNRAQADLVLLSGDLFDGGDLYGETLDALVEALGSIQAEVFIAPGNHDFWTTHSAYARKWPKHIHIFTEPNIEQVELPELNCTVYGTAFTGPYREDRPLQDFHAPDDGRIHIMVLHGDLSPNSRYAPITREDLEGSGLDYVALGHIHTCSGVQRAGKTSWAYPGCPEGRGFDETGDKGVLCGVVGSGGAELAFASLCTRRYLIQEVDVTGREIEEAVRAALPEQVSPDLCRIILTGERSEEPNLSALLALAAPHYYSVSLRDHTRLRQDLWKRAEEDTLTGLVLRDLKRRMEEAPSEEERASLELAARFALAALEHREDPL